jgi:hypothetical protein
LLLLLQFSRLSFGVIFVTLSSKLLKLSFLLFSPDFSGHFLCELTELENLDTKRITERRNVRIASSFSASFNFSCQVLYQVFFGREF